jgi:hypothetical protein
VSAHPDAFDGLVQKLRRAKDPVIIDRLLDQWLEWEKLATEYDAEQWSFEEDWMKDERAKLGELGKPSDEKTETKKS